MFNFIEDGQKQQKYVLLNDFLNKLDKCQTKNDVRFIFYNYYDEQERKYLNSIIEYYFDEAEILIKYNLKKGDK
jgi:hypothetical protein